MKRPELRITLRVPADATDAECVDALECALVFRRDFATRESTAACVFSGAHDDYKTSVAAWWSKARGLIAYYSRGDS